MIVNLIESTSRNLLDILCYNSTTDILIVPEELINYLQAPFTSISPLVKHYTNLVDSGYSSESFIKLDEYLGSIGISYIKEINIGVSINGIC